MTRANVRAAYSERAVEYTNLLGSIEQATPEDREQLLDWANSIRGPILDVGCGPGQWTDYLRGSGANIEGIDPVAAFIESARSRFPSSQYRVGSAENLGVAAASLGGILAWYSLIHIDPGALDTSLAEFARCLRPGGRLLMGYFEGPAGEPFEHAVVTAYFWSASELKARLNSAGLTVVEAVSRTDPGSRPHGALIAEKSR